MIHLPPRSHKNSTTEIRLHIEGYGLCGRYLISPGVKGAYAVREPQMPKGVEHEGKETDTDTNPEKRKTLRELSRVEIVSRG